MIYDNDATFKVIERYFKEKFGDKKPSRGRHYIIPYHHSYLKVYVSSRGFIRIEGIQNNNG